MNGFLNYEKTHTLDASFMEDFSNLCAKLYKTSGLRTSYEEFYGFCEEKLVIRIPAFDPNRSNIGNYVYNLILNEIRRIRSKEKHVSTADMDMLSLYHEANPGQTPELIHQIQAFAVRAYSLGIYVDQLQLLSQYQAEVMSPVVKAFGWLLYRGEL